MRYLQLSVASGVVGVHPLFPLMAESAIVETAWMLDWNVVRSPTTTALFRVAGDREGFEAALANEPVVLDHEVTGAAGDEFYVHLHTETQPVERRLFMAFNQERSLLVPPLTYADGTVTCRIVGTAAELRRALDDVPDGLETSVQRVGEFDNRPGETLADLTDRQRQALDAAVAAGYYEVPREATTADVGARLDVDPSTAAEHLRKAEARLVRAFVEG